MKRLRPGIFLNICLLALLRKWSQEASCHFHLAVSMNRFRPELSCALMPSEVDFALPRRAWYRRSPIAPPSWIVHRSDEHAFALELSPGLSSSGTDQSEPEIVRLICADSARAKLAISVDFRPARSPKTWCPIGRRCAHVCVEPSPARIWRYAVPFVPDSVLPSSTVVMRRATHPGPYPSLPAGKRPWRMPDWFPCCLSAPQNSDQELIDPGQSVPICGNAACSATGWKGWKTATMQLLRTNDVDGFQAVCIFSTEPRRDSRSSSASRSGLGLCHTAAFSV